MERYSEYKDSGMQWLGEIPGHWEMESLRTFLKLFAEKGHGDKQLDEQSAIVSYITDKTTKIDTLVGKLQQEIESIKEYKQHLISDVVTGQIKV